MKDFVKHLKFILRRNNSVVLPGIGVLKLVKLPAFINDGKVVFAPSQSLILDSDTSVSSDGNLIASIMKKQGVTEVEATEMVENRMQQIMHSLNTTGLFILGSLGQLFLKNGIIEFRENQNSSAFNAYYLFKGHEERQSKEVEHLVHNMNGGRTRKIISMLGSLILLSMPLLWPIG